MMDAMRVFSLARQQFKNHPFNKYGPWKYWSAWRVAPDILTAEACLQKKGIIKDIRKVDDYTVKLSSMKLMLPSWLTLPSIYPIVSPTAVKKYGADFGKNPVGFDTFSFVKWVKDDNVTLKKNEDYSGEKAKIR